MNIEIFDKAAEYLPDSCFDTPPDVAVVLGSGWGEALEMDDMVVRIPYADIPGMGASTVKGHQGEFILYRRGDKRIAAWCGRRHWYEGAGWEPAVMPVELSRRMGCQKALLTNAAGGINPALRPGDFVIIRDHVNLSGGNPLIGPHREEWGARFPDMSEVYCRHLAELLHAGANRLGIRAMDGVYAFATGPCYETPAEIRAYKALGIDAVGMSTVPEAMFANACGMKIAGLSLISNLAAGISPRPLDHKEVMEAGAAAKPLMASLIGDFLERL
ncbi:MAG: purine-nucleoside phosphorylase [Kiritimatiellae bacterium]|nr:purine-nucleoside phosphorylase [Kiritimatiellia bacterium]